MAGGSGTRFWPKSTSQFPKQFLSFSKEKGSLLQQTLSRFDGLVDPKHHFVVTTEKLAPIVKSSVEVKILAEPQGRNTAPCIYWSAREIAKQDSTAVMLVMPSDHHIPDLNSFQKTVRLAIERAEKTGELVALGVKPTRPETGYGYLKIGKSLEGECQQVEKFVEKPNLEKAQEFFQSGNYLWNGGMFVWRVDAILEAFDQYMPELKQSWERHNGIVEKAYPEMTATSIDFGVMEKAKNVSCFPLDCGWDDLGSWISLENLSKELGSEHPSGTVTGGQVVDIDSKGNIIDCPEKLVALIGIEDCIIVNHEDRILVARKERSQDIKQIVDRLKTLRPDLV